MDTPSDKKKTTRARTGSGRVGIRDVAHDAGVSVATVSRTLANDGYPVSEESRKKVLRSVAKLGFVPNDLARGLSQDRTNTIGVIVPNVLNQYYAQVVMGVEEVAAQHGISTIFCNTNNSVEKLELDIRVLLQKRVDGIILCGSSPDLERSAVKNMLTGWPFVAIGRNDKLECPTVHADNYKAGYDAAKHVISQGRTKLLFLSGPKTWADGSDRIAGFKACVAEHRLPEEDVLMSYGAFSEEDAYQRVMQLRPSATGVIGANDRVAVGAMAALYDLGKRIPDDVAIVGFDNIPSSTFVRPSLTTMDVPAKNMGAEGMRLILKIQRGEAVPSRTVFVAPLLVRQSA